jgi:hypothetical protein
MLSVSSYAFYRSAPFPSSPLELYVCIPGILGKSYFALSRGQLSAIRYLSDRRTIEGSILYYTLSTYGTYLSFYFSIFRIPLYFIIVGSNAYVIPCSGETFLALTGGFAQTS